jgi:hypothetical protein
VDYHISLKINYSKNCISTRTFVYVWCRIYNFGASNSILWTDRSNHELQTKIILCKSYENLFAYNFFVKNFQFLDNKGNTLKIWSIIVCSKRLLRLVREREKKKKSFVLLPNYVVTWINSPYGGDKVCLVAP